MILIVGADGEMGSCLLEEARARPLECAGTSRRPDSRYRVDLLQPTSAWALPARVDAAILSAGITNLRACEENPAATRAVNIEGIKRLADSLAQRGATLTFLSSSAVFSGVIHSPDETAPVSPVSEYGHQKAEIEAWLANAHPTAKIVRLTKVVSQESPRLREWATSLRQGKPIHAFGNLFASLISRKHTAQALLSISTAPASGIFHLSASDAISYFQTARGLASALGTSPALVIESSAPHPNKPEETVLAIRRTLPAVFSRMSSQQHLAEVLL